MKHSPGNVNLSKDIKHIWCERLTLFKLAWLLILAIFRRYEKAYFMGYSKGVSMLARVAKKIGVRCKFIKHKQLELGVTDENGRNLRYAAEEDSRYYVEKLFSLSMRDEKNTPHNYEIYHDDWTRLHKITLLRQVKIKVSFFYMIEQYCRKDADSSEARIVMWLDNCILEKQLCDMVRLKFQHGYNIKLWPSIKYSLKFFPVPGLVIYTFLLALKGIGKKKAYQNIATLKSNQGRIFEEYFFKIYARYPHTGHLFWFSKSGIDSQRVILYFDRPDSLCSDKNRKQVESHGMCWIDFSNLAAEVEKPIRTFFLCIRNAPIPKRFTSYEIAVWAYTIQYLFQLESFREIFRRYNCKILHQHQEFSPTAILSALAIRMEGGIFLWNHWSVDHCPVAYFYYGYADLVLSWSLFNDGYFNCHNFSYKYLVQTGMIAGGFYAREDDNAAKKLREKISDKVKFVISVFDSSHGIYNEQSHSSMLYFYQQILDIVLKHPCWGIMIKSKGNSFKILPKRDYIQGAVEILKKEGRCLLIDGSMRVSPACRAAEVSVCYGINSAGIVAALHGKKAIHWDLPDIVEHPLHYLGGRGKVIFKTRDEIESALEAIESGDKEIGNHEQWLYIYDSFRDNAGAERTGDIVARFLSYCDEGMDRDSALFRTISEYSSKWGDDKVSTPDKVNEHEGNLLWRRVQNTVRAASRCTS